MDSFVEQLKRGTEEEFTEESAWDGSVVNTTSSSLPTVYLPLLPRYLWHPTTRGRKATEFQETKKACLNYIQDALLQHQWQRAAEFMTNYLETLESTSAEKRMAAPEVIWRIGTEILCHHPKSSIEEFNYFAERMKNLGVKRYLKVCLEHVFHLLCNGLIDDAYQNLSLAEGWRYGEQTVAQDKELKLIQAYKGLLDYYNWAKKRKAMLELDGNFADSVEQEMHSFFRQAAVNLKEIIKIPGVWDPFVKCYVDLLEFYEDYDEVRQVLSEYAYNSKFPPNPNAHVYYYQFLKRQGESKKTLKSVLKILHEIVPSHELMLEYNAMLQKSKKRKNHRLGLEIIFTLLDFAGWKEHVKAWSCLAKQIKQILEHSSKHLDWVTEEWNSRKDWWPAFHFSHYLAKRNWQENESLACEKALVAGILLGKDCKYFKYVSHQGCKAKKEKFRTMKKFVKKHSSTHLRASGVLDSCTHL
ncbi:TATA box-binding protein-associated factor RNA polymerase I subunit A isoform X1 [Malaclemys terrapin pileata]|uniref:TATA box-binding protein-associated factor RNA polymerase I subunit A isoform X1 n=2 Tax=Malaclemys terrapin pileata TaxID=2991368 RepID=UPI0023A7FD33|nr:TATA box-binding protein-associated factor RNA polymerase I subunit A isoform X1 [Malaclemys terrapin pileata]XP_053879017.1 TATA box-binding protein-associated factor RNA polymerase I subunit A isoform X1 [Malaclemys terrapin pileata]XP_053879018.1 TATA box-binding protein-associated factor RNA polymerase I subunit A isoform X1 [Malaclemys terrapin pileata]XP_053879019.1 TATA box-binding protein-associated factor RNA polymerase I subunit A isoform X1 [Malaclemys terrapin pileata]XP_05387902